MGIQDLNSQIKDYAKDVKRNLSLLFHDFDAPGLDQKLVWGIGLATSYSIRDDELTSYLKENAKKFLDPDEIEGIKSAVIIQSVKNIYNRSIDLAERPLLDSMSPHLYETIVSRPTIGQLDFHYYALACAIINGSQKCLQQEINYILEYGGDFEGIHSTIRIAAVLEGASQSLHLARKAL